MRNRLFLFTLLILAMISAKAQNTDSPYSRYGYGLLEYPALGKSRGIGGVGIGIREKSTINPANPATYSAIDTMTMLFDFGVTGNVSYFKEGTIRQTNPNGGLDYVAMEIPLKKGWGVALGLTPYSKVGYAFQQTYDLTDDISYVKQYAGSGGLSTVFLGSSVALSKRWSAGINLNYRFGNIVQSSAVSSSSGLFNATSTSEYWFLRGLSYDLGVQYQLPLGKNQLLTLGGTVAGKTKLHNEIYQLTITTDSSELNTSSRFELPVSLGLGASWLYDNRLTVAFDFQRQWWNDTYFRGVKDSLSNQTRMALGMEYLPAIYTDRYYKAIKYRFGCYYTDSYMKDIFGNIGVVGVTVGFGLPLRSQRTALNLTFEAGRMLLPDPSLIHENFYQVSLDLTFGETWFFKRKL